MVHRTLYKLDVNCKVDNKIQGTLVKYVINKVCD